MSPVQRGERNTLLHFTGKKRDCFPTSWSTFLPLAHNTVFIINLLSRIRYISTLCFAVHHLIKQTPHAHQFAAYSCVADTTQPEL